jgi:hypothetical protein
MRPAALQRVQPHHGCGVNFRRELEADNPLLRVGVPPRQALVEGAGEEHPGVHGVPRRARHAEQMPAAAAAAAAAAAVAFVATAFTDTKQRLRWQGLPGVLRTTSRFKFHRYLSRPYKDTMMYI